MKKIVRSRKGFSLVETIIAVSLAIILALAAFIGGGKLMESARATRVQSDLDSFQTAIQQMFYEHPEYAKTGASVAADQLNAYLPTELKVTGTASEKTDPWGTAYTVEFSAISAGIADVIVTSAGPDVTANNEDDMVLGISSNKGEVKTATIGLKSSTVAADTVTDTGTDPDYANVNDLKGAIN